MALESGGAEGGSCALGWCWLVQVVARGGGGGGAGGGATRRRWVRCLSGWLCGGRSCGGDGAREWCGGGGG